MSVHEIAGLSQEILQGIDAHQEEIVAFAQGLLRIPSVNSPPTGDEKAAQEYLAQKLRQLGLHPDLFSPAEVAGLEEHPAYWIGGSNEVARDYENRPNLTCVWKGSGGGRSLIMAGHVDVVTPGPLMLWQRDPWGATLEQGRIYARGAIDDKGSLAAMVMAIAGLREMNLTLKGDLILQSFVDEEYGGGNGAVANLVRGYQADAVLMAEPTDLHICPATYGCQSLGISVYGRSAHPIERWKGVDTIALAFRVYQSLLDLERRRATQAQAWQYFREARFPVPLVVRRIEALTPGGGAMPDLCEMQVWMTTLPHETQETVLAQVKQHLASTLPDVPSPGCRPLEIRPVGRLLEATLLPERHDFVQEALGACRQALGREPNISVGTAGDGYIYANYGAMPMIEFGPGSIDRAHAPDEYIGVDELLAATKAFALLIAGWCGVV